MAKRKPAVAVRFVSVERAFKPQVEVRATRDLNGWVNRERGVKFHIGKGRKGYMDAERAREYAAKGFVVIVQGDVKPVSDMEREELLSQVTVVGL